MKASDYIAQFIAEQGVRHAFVLTGGCIVHSIDSIARRGDIRYIPVQHEQAGAMAADAYSRVTDNLGVVLTTSGPGATNLLTGTCCSYYDSVPVLNITGQVPISQLKRTSKSRQIGFQETDVVSIFESVTKYAVLVDDPKRIRYELEKAVSIAKSGRPGPVVVDICDDIQRANIEPSALESFKAPSQEKNLVDLENKAAKLFGLLAKAERPVVILGGAVRLAGAATAARRFIGQAGLPYTLTWATMDLMDHSDPLYVGGFGVTSGRPGNFAVQNADLIVAIGTRLDTHEAGPDLKKFGRGAQKVIVDLDPAELEKYEARGMPVDLPICADVRDFFEVVERNWASFTRGEIAPWLERIRIWKQNYPICLPEYDNETKVNPYVFMRELSGAVQDDAVVVTDCGSNLIWTMQGFMARGNQRLISAFNHSPMGYSLPASMGAALAKGGPVVCITGDGGLQMNIQELATIERHNIPVKIFVMNNHGHGIIQGTLDSWLDGRHYAASPDFGLPDPDYTRVAQAYGLKTETIRDHRELSYKMTEVLQSDGPVLCNVELLNRNQIAPKLLYGRPLEDPHPLLKREEFRRNMIVEPIS
ncbi:MAG: thiamine pyrophosphate-binding protein [Elusimicrobia bacterium]|nr:thiamine pyrophosphate-binding protein [Elusimicrobiota bacterium]